MLFLAISAALAASPLCIAQSAALPPLTEPYTYVHGGQTHGSNSSFNPDPLQAYHWEVNKLKNASALQLYDRSPVTAAAAINASSFSNLDALTAGGAGKAAGVSGPTD